MENLLSWIEKILEFIKNYSVANILKACVFVIIFAILLAVITHPKESLTSITTAVIEVVQIINQEQHSKNMMARQQADIQINQLLDRTINDAQADVILILEGHNGNENINGLGFSYLKTTYKKEKCTDYKAPLFVWKTEWETGIHPMVDYLNNNYWFYGSTEDVATIDVELARYLEINKLSFCVLVEIPKYSDVNKSAGVLGYFYKSQDSVPTRDRIRTNMLSVRDQLRFMLICQD